ncbi:MAG: 2,3,4,5-tetrahydropyridine-2,6-dicarboxylate N-succinyltransferase, partial [Acidobacteriota bacterium]
MIETIEKLLEKEQYEQTDRDLMEAFLDELDSGKIRAAEQVDGQWKVNPWVKKGILAGFRL